MVSPARYASLAALLLTGCGRYFFDEHTDASATGDARPCSHTFCDDFDRSGPPEAGWDTRTTGGPAVGIATLANDTVVSPPQSLLISVPTDGTNLTGNTFLHKQLPMATTKVVVHASLSYATAMTMNTEADFLQVQWDMLPNGCTDYGFFLVRDGTKPLNLQETYAGTGVCAGGSVQNTTIDLDNAGFKDLLLEITFGPSGSARLKLTIEGTSVIDKVATHGIDASTLTFSIGGGISRNGLAPWQVRYDDVWVDIDR